MIGSSGGLALPMETDVLASVALGPIFAYLAIVAALALSWVVSLALVARRHGTIPLAIAGLATLGAAVFGAVDRAAVGPLSVVGALLAAAAVAVPMLTDEARLSLASGWVLLGALFVIWNAGGDEGVVGQPVRHQARGTVEIDAEHPVVVQEVVVSSHGAPAGALLHPPAVHPDDLRVRATVVKPDGLPADQACVGCDDRYLAVFRLESGTVAFEVDPSYTVTVPGETLAIGRRDRREAVEADFVEVTVRDSDVDVVRLSATAGVESEHDPARPLDFARVTASLPATAVPPAGFGVFPAYWTATATAPPPSYAHLVGFGELLDPRSCVADRACTMRTVMLLGSTAALRPHPALGVDVFAAADYVAPPFPPGDAELALEVTRPAAWVHRTVSGRLDSPSGEVRIRLELTHDPLPTDVAAAVLVGRVGYHAIEAVECPSGTCTVTVWALTSESGGWSADVYWGLWDVDGVPEGFDPQVEVVEIEIDEDY